MWNNRLQDLYCITNAETELEIEGAKWHVVYDQQQNQFDVKTVELILDLYPDDRDDYLMNGEVHDIELIFKLAEEMLQEEHERNFDYGHEL